MTTDQHWLTRAACTPEDGKADVFDYDPHRPNGKARAEIHEFAKQICMSCPVIHFCVLTALDEEAGASAQNRYEIRGGLTPLERAALDPKAGKRKASRPTASGVNATQPIGHRTHCVRNHDLIGDNVYMRPGRTTPECVTCMRENKRKSDAKRAAKQKGEAA